MLPLGAVAFHFFAKRHGWSLFEQIALYGFTVLTLYFQAATSWYTAPLLIHKKLAANFRASLLSSTARLGISGMLHAMALLSASTLYVINTAATGANMLLARKVALPFIEEPSNVSPNTRSELLRYIIPLAPGIIFFAFLGQITIFLISIFGSTRSIAEVGALGRLGQLFAVFGALNATVIWPYFARLPASLLLKQYFLALVVVISGSALLVLGAFLCPAPLLSLLGSKYANMQHEMLWMLVASSLGFLDGLMHGIAMSRKWVFWWGAFLSITLVLAAQCLMLYMRPMNTSLSVILFSVATNGALFVGQIIVAIRGLVLLRRSDPFV